MKVIVLENFHVFEAALEGQPERRVSYGRGMVLPGVPADVARSWVDKGLVRAVEAPKADTETAAERPR